MTDRTNPYEAAFEQFLRLRGVPYVAVDESRRAHWADAGPQGASLKILDFIVSPRAGASWLVDIKGRRFPGGRQRQYWKNWSTHDDLLSLARWQTLFGQTSRAALVFAYAITGDRAPLPADQLLSFRDQWYGFVAIGLEQYAAWARPVSERWNTWAMPTGLFRRLAVPFADLL